MHHRFARLGAGTRLTSLRRSAPIRRSGLLIGPLAAGLALGACGSSGGSSSHGGGPSAGGSSNGVRIMVDGRHATLLPTRATPAPAATVTVAGRRCAIPADTPLAALIAARRAGGPAVALKDFAHCSSKAKDAGGIYVTRIGPDAAQGKNGWVTKVGGKLGSEGAASPKSRVHPGQEVRWLYCRMGKSGCQRTLALRPASRAVKPGAALRVRVVGQDDHGGARPDPGATVTLGSARARTGANGTATLRAPRSAGSYRVSARDAGLAPAFPVGVRVG